MNRWQLVYLGFLFIAGASIAVLFTKINSSNDRIEKLVTTNRRLIAQNFNNDRQLNRAVDEIDKIQQLELKNCRARHLVIARQRKALLAQRRHARKRGRAKLARQETARLKNLRQLDCNPQEIKRIFRLKLKTRLVRIRVGGKVITLRVPMHTVTRTVTTPGSTRTVTITLPGGGTKTTTMTTTVAGGPGATRTVTRPVTTTVTRTQTTQTITTPGMTTTVPGGHGKPCKHPPCKP